VHCWNHGRTIVSRCRSASKAFVSRFSLLARGLVLSLVLLTRSRPPSRGQSPRRGFPLLFSRTISHHKLRLPMVSELLSKIPVLGLKIDKHTLESVSPNKARIIYASAAISSMLLPFLVLPTAYIISIPVGTVFTLLTLANSLFTIYFSSHVGDLHRAGIRHDILVSHPKPDYSSNA